MVTNRSAIADFYLINEEPQNICSVNIYWVEKCSMTKKDGETLIYKLKYEADTVP
jgi:hypothetical protein